MKRHPALVPLSMEHHRSLLLAKHCRQAAESGDGQQVAARIDDLLRQRTLWAGHFEREECCLFELAAGLDPDLVARLRREHERMLDWLARMQQGETQWLGPFGELLGAHTRLEERVLFPLLESLPETKLERIRDCLAPSG